MCISNELSIVSGATKLNEAQGRSIRCDHSISSLSVFQNGGRTAQDKREKENGFDSHRR